MTMPELAFRYSLWKLVALLCGAALMEAWCIWTAWGHPDPAPDTTTLYVAHASVWFFGVGLVVIIVHLFRSGKVAVTIGPGGFRDSRISDDVIPCNAIIDASLYTTRSTVVGVHLVLDPKFVPQLHWNRIPGLRRLSDRMLTATGLIIPTGELNTEPGFLLKAIQAHLKPVSAEDNRLGKP
jgi:hypothetical protein